VARAERAALKEAAQNPSSRNSARRKRVAAAEAAGDTGLQARPRCARCRGGGYEGLVMAGERPCQLCRGTGHDTADVHALRCLFGATDGHKSWGRNSGWLAEGDVSKWYGVGADLVSGRVTSLKLNANGLRGSLPPELGLLSALRTLDLRDNGRGLGGALPADAVGELRELRVLWLSGNGLSGHLPATLGRLAKLRSVRLGGNALAGPIPRELGRCAALQHLSLEGNRLSGTLPPELCACAALENVWLQRNDLSGALPPALGALPLAALNLAHNALRGAIPPSLGACASLKTCNLAHNALEGEVPPGLRHAPQLMLHCNDALVQAVAEDGDGANGGGRWWLERNLAGGVQDRAEETELGAHWDKATRSRDEPFF
jgi:hypothetical protein